MATIEGLRRRRRGLPLHPHQRGRLALPLSARRRGECLGLVFFFLLLRCHFQSGWTRRFLRGSTGRLTREQRLDAVFALLHRLDERRRLDAYSADLLRDGVAIRGCVNGCVGRREERDT